MRKPILIFILIMAAAISMTARQKDFPKLTGPYLGQEPPGMTPEIFAPGIISTDISEGCSGWGNDMEYFIFQRWVNRKSRLFIMNNHDGTWTSPKHLAELDQYGIGDFTIAPDGVTMVFASRILTDEFGTSSEGGNIWMMKKTGTGWSKPMLMDLAINTKYHDSYPSLAANGNLYFFSRRPGGLGQSDLYVSVFFDGKYGKAVNLGHTLNTDYHEWDPYIAPDESYMIYCSMMPGGAGDDDLYVTFRRPDKSWGKPVYLGDKINSKKSENRPYVTPDGKYLFYASTRKGNRDIYWVSSDIIYILRNGH